MGWQIDQAEFRSILVDPIYDSLWKEMITTFDKAAGGKNPTDGTVFLRTGLPSVFVFSFVTLRR
jgi:hypothetical protein